MRTSTYLLVWMAAVALGAVAQAANYINTASGGNWNDPASWTLGSGTPGAGDTIALTGAGPITVTADAQFGAASGSSASSWNKAAPAPLLVLTNGAVLTHNSSDTLTVGANSTAYYLLGGGGGERLLNLGTIAEKNAWGGTLNLTNGVTLENRGLYKFEDIGASVTIDGSSTFLVNDGTIQAGDYAAIGARQAGATLTTHDGSTLKSMNLVLTGGGANKGLTIGVWNGQSGNGFTLTGQVAIASMTIASDTCLAFANVDMTVAFPAIVAVSGGMQIGRSLYPSSAYGLGKLTLANSTTWSFGAGVVAYGGIIDTAGYTLTLQGTNTFAQGNGSSRLVAGATGGVVNQGTLFVGPAGGTDYYGLTVSNSAPGVAFVNTGTIRLRAMGASTFGGDALSIAANTTFSNAPGAFFLGDAPGRGWYRAGVVGASASTSVFDNQGTVHVLTNALYFYDSVKIAQITGASLNGGTWKASVVPPAGAPETPPSLRLPGSNIQTIGADATVVIENGGTINTIGSALATVNGRFLVNGSSVFTNSPLTVAGTIGGSGTLKGNVTVNGGTLVPGAQDAIGTFTINGNLDMQGGCTYEWHTDGTNSDLVAMSGTLTLPSVATVTVIQASGKLPNPGVLISGFTNSLATDLSGWVINGAGPTTRARVSGNQVVLTSSKGCVLYVQ